MTVLIYAGRVNVNVGFKAVFTILKGGNRFFLEGVDFWSGEGEFLEDFEVD